MKRITAIILTVLTVFTFFSVSANAYEGSTSFDFRYPEAFESVQKYYNAFSKSIDTVHSDIPVPGNILSEAYSPETGTDETENMVAQGLWITDDYILVTAYDSENEYNSLLYVISNDNEHILLAVIVLPDKNHSGGIASDGKNIYIARSDSGISCFSYNKINDAVEQKGLYILGEYDKTFKTEKTASFVTVYENKLWLGEFNEKSESYLCDYIINSDGNLERGRNTLLMPEKLQGAAFFVNKGKKYLFASCSYGRTNTSDVYIFEITDDKNKMLYKYAFPPMSEEAAYYEGEIYLIFESSSTKYSTKESRCPSPVDRIVALDTNVLIDSSDQNKMLDFFSRVRDIFLKIVDFLLSLFR